MAEQGPSSCGTAANDTSFGTRSWNSPGSIVGGGGEAQAFTSSLTFNSHYLKATNYGFTIPSATIDGIKLRVKRRAVSLFGCVRHDSRVRLVKGGSVGSTDKADTSTEWPSVDVGEYATYGGPTDLWGESWTPSDINSSNFGAVISAYVDDSGAGDEGRVAVQDMEITVYYTAILGGLRIPMKQVRQHNSFQIGMVN